MTLGAGGHAEALLSAGVERVIGIDRDPARWRSPRERLAAFGDAVPAGADHVLRGRRRADGRAGRRRPLRPRACRRCSSIRPSAGSAIAWMVRSTCGWAGRRRRRPTAADLVNELPETELADLIYEYGGEHRSRRIARAIVRETADHDDRSARRRRRGRAGQATGGPPPRASHVPGAPYRGQPGDRGVRRLPASGGRAPRSRWPRGRDRLPLPGGPDREAVVPRGRASHGPDEEAATADRRGGGSQPSRPSRAPARRRADGAQVARRGGHVSVPARDLHRSSSPPARTSAPRAHTRGASGTLHPSPAPGAP